MEEMYWKQFENSGRIEDYLSFRSSIYSHMMSEASCDGSSGILKSRDGASGMIKNGDDISGTMKGVADTFGMRKHMSDSDRGMDRPSMGGMT